MGVPALVSTGKLEQGTSRQSMEKANASFFPAARLMQAYCGISLLPIPGNPEKAMESMHELIQYYLRLAQSEHNRIARILPLAG